ncbi:protein takeout [Scaptodrosophila lebanonensis]|uniref:Protein takeout n=1 Tax=Drosophila lebanonensis TaxID=7225 RepID=A0A6J2TIW5_DROLE|nr:protein takeout [Scaptodrosophila lebanonensis]
MVKNWLMSVVYMAVLLSTGQAFSQFNKNSKSRLPSFLKVCYRDDPELSTCARKSFESLEERLIEGIPELYIPPMEPLVVPEIKMDQDSGAIYLHSIYKNVKISGISKHTLNDLQIVPLKFTVSLTFPQLHMESDYNIKGKIMMMPLLGDGRCSVDLTNITMVTELHGQEYKKHGITHIKIADIKVKYEVDNVKMHLDNLFNGDKVLGQKMNDFLNENWKTLAEEVRPLMTKALVDILRASVDKLFDAFSYDELLPKTKH